MLRLMTRLSKLPRPEVEALQFGRDCARWVPRLTLPSYRYIPGVTPRPKAGGTGVLSCEVELTSATWAQCTPYLAGVDLFNQAFWWEAHESWELPWCARRGSCYGTFLQGLILVAASLVKWQQGNYRGMNSLIIKARRNLTSIAQKERKFMGLDLVDFDRRLRSILEAATDPPRALEIFGALDSAPVIYLESTR